MEKEGRQIWRKESLLFLLLVVISFAPIVWLFFAWYKIPGQVPLHYDAALRPNKISSRNWVWVVAIILATISLLLPILLQSKTLKNKTHGAIEFNGKEIILIGTGLCLAVVNLFFIVSTYRGTYLFEQYGFTLIGTLIGLVGLYGKYTESCHLSRSSGLQVTKREVRIHKLLFFKANFLCWSAGALIILSVLLPSSQLFPIFIGFLILLGASSAIYFLFQKR